MDAKPTSKLIKRLISEPEETLHHIDLVYVDDSKLTIVREGKKDSFTYKFHNKTLNDKIQLQRIDKLVIPPAWKRVRITHLNNGHLQAVGRDAKKRKQYRYHNTWSKFRNETKFYRLADFGEHLSSIRKKVEKDLAAKEWSQAKTLALVIKLMDETHMRIGNFQYARHNNTYGLATLRKKHVVHNQNKLRFEFIGKRGKEHKVTLRNKKLIRLVRQCEEIPGWELFQFYDDNGDKRKVDSKMVNEYLFEATKKHFTAKDFRTWSATVCFFEHLDENSFRAAKSSKREKMILKAYDEAARALGNTRNVCRKYYVHPEIADGVIDNFNRLRNDFKNKNLKKESYLTDSEKQVLFLIKDYRPNLD